MVQLRIALLGLLASVCESFAPVRTSVLEVRQVPQHDNRRRIAANVANSISSSPSEDDQQAVGLRAVISNVTYTAMESLSMQEDVDEEALGRKRRQLAQRQLQSGTYRVQLDLGVPLGLTLAQVQQGRQMLERTLDLDQLIMEERRATRSGSTPVDAHENGVARQSMDWPTMAGRMDPDFHGLLVSSVVQGGIAWKAGIRAGDILTAVSATVGGGLWPTSTLEGVQSAWRSRNILSQNAVMEFRRLEEQVDNVYELTLEKPLGLEIKETADGFVVVTGFTESAPNLVRHAVRLGDRIIAVDSSWGDRMWPVSTVEGLVSACTSRFRKNTVRLRLERPVENLHMSASDSIETAENPKTLKSSRTTAPNNVAAPQKSNVEKQELLKRCRDVLKRYSSDAGDKVAAVAAFKGKYDVPAIVADKVVDTLASERLAVDSVTLSMIMGAYLSCNQPESALRVFEAATGWRADGSPLPLEQSLVGRNGGGFVPNESALNLYVGTAAMQAHAQRGDIRAVSRVLAALEGRSGVLVGGLESAPWPFTGAYGTIRPDTQCYNIAIAAAEKAGGEEALEMGLALFEKMSDPQQFKTSADPTPSRDVVTYNTIISALCNAGRYDQALRLFDRMKRSGIRPDKFTYTSLIKVCTNDGDTQELLYDMQERGVKGDVRTYNTMIKSLCSERKLSEAMKMVSEMEARGVSPDSMTYGFLMNAMLKADKATACLTLFESACANEKTARLTDNVYLYTTAITAASTLGNYERALELVTRMSAKGVKPNLKTLTAVVTACIFAGKPDLAIQIFRKIEAPDGYAMSQGLRAYCDNGNYAEALSILKQQRRRDTTLSGKQIMLSYKNILQASLVNGDFDVAMDAMTDLLKKGFIPNKAMLNAMLHTLNVQNSRHIAKLVPADETVATFNFLLFVLDALTERNLPIESPLYISILSLGNVLGGRAKRVVGDIAQSRVSSESAGTLLVSSSRVRDENGIAENELTSWPGWKAVHENDELDSSRLITPQIQVRVLPKEIGSVLKAETTSAITKSRKRRTE